MIRLSRLVTSIFPALFVLLSAIFLIACQPQLNESELSKVTKESALKVGILFTPTSYFIDSNGPSGFEYELVQHLGAYLDVEVELIPSFHNSELLQKLDSQQIDLLVGAGPIENFDPSRYRFAPPYFYVDQKLVFKQGRQRPKSFEEMDAPITVGKGSSHEALLNTALASHPELVINTIDGVDPSELLELLMSEEIEYTVADSHTLALARRYYPDISVAFTVEKDVPLRWVLPNNQDDSMYAVLIDFFGQLHDSGELIVLDDRYFGHVEKFNYVDTRLFIQAIDEVLPKYRDWFIQYSGDIDWRLIAAQSYQESHWDPRAKSPTGVRGIMMLTQPTAKQMGVKSRLDAESNIRGGARYLNQLMLRIPNRIEASERPWFALAAYNLGWGHVQDARALTKRLNGDPDKWVDVKQHLPKLRQKKYYKTTRYGFARGDEAVTYVDNIRRYYDTLNWIEEQALQQQQVEQQIEELKNNE